jgi:hypothetical protein
MLDRLSRFLGRLSVGRKLLLIFVLDMSAVAYISSILVHEKYLAIDFARSELAGSAYIAALRPALIVGAAAARQSHPPSAELLADVTAHALRQLASAPGKGGLYHVCAGGQTSWHGYARHVIDWARAAGRPVKVSADQVRPIPTSAYPTPATRPLNSRLDTRRFQATFGLVLPEWRCGVDRMLSEL